MSHLGENAFLIFSNNISVPCWGKLPRDVSRPLMVLMPLGWGKGAGAHPSQRQSFKQGPPMDAMPVRLFVILGCGFLSVFG